MHLENKFLFIGKAFLVIFLIINTVNLIPLDLFNVFYYTKFFNVLLDTSTLLLLGLAIPRFLYIRKINILNKLKNNNIKELDDINVQIDNFERKEKNNYNITKFCFVFFAIILFVQPVNLLLVLNRNDIYLNQTIL